MTLIIALNIIFAIAVVGGIVGLLAHSIWTGRPAVTEQRIRAARLARARRQPARRLAPTAG